MRAPSAAMLLVAVAALTAEAAAGSGTLSRTDIEAAIVLGDTHEPQPYLLRHAGRHDNPVVVAAVYTPFLRVAFLSRAAAVRGERLVPGDLDASVTAPLVYLAFRWYCCDNVSTEPETAFASSEPRVAMLPIAPRAPEFVRFTDRRQYVRPVWSQQGAAALETFAAAPPFDDLALVAAFPATVLDAGRPFVIYKDAEGEQRIRIGVVRTGDAAAWR